MTTTSQANLVHPAAGNALTNRSRGLPIRLAALFLVAVAILAFEPTLNNDFVNWDDDHNLVLNDGYRGLSRENLEWMFTTSHGGHYQPLSWLSFALESQVWGVSPVGFHLTNVVLHVLTALTFFYVARRLICATAQKLSANVLTVAALTAALFFAVHPLRVESVAWATERRDVLSAVWLMLATVCYLKSVGSPVRGRWLTAAMVCYVLSLLSKAIGVTWPLVLLILDAYPLRRFARQERSIGQSGPRLHGIIGEKVLFAIPAVAIAGLALWAQGQSGALRAIEEHSIGVRIGQAFYGIAFYLHKTIWPFPLLPLYEQDPSASAWDAANLISLGVAVALTGLFILIRRRQPAWLAAWAVYLVLLVPVLGLAQSGPQVVADRYSYLPSTAWAVLIGGGVAQLCTLDRRAVRRLTGAAGVALVAALTLLTRSQVRVWHDSRALWTHVLKHAPETGTAHANLANLLVENGEYTKAREHARQALTILPGNRVAHVALARASVALGDLQTAREHLEIALEIRSHDPPRLIALADVYQKMGEPEGAETLCRKAIDLEPDNPAWRFSFAVLLASEGRYEESIRLFKETLQRDPDHLDALYRLGIVLSKSGDFEQAVDTFEAGLRKSPRHNAICTELAWLYATCPVEELRNGSRAVELALIAVKDSRNRNLRAREALAYAYACVDDFPRAAAILEELLDDEEQSLDAIAMKRIRDALESWRSRAAPPHER
jgi:tetratricopeptide (TPR) repeat protein